MTSPLPNENPCRPGQPRDAENVAPPPARSNAKTLKHQVKEVNRLVDNAKENLEQVLRALRYIENDL